MLPFLKPKHIADVIVASKKPGGEVSNDHEEESEEIEPMKACAEDLIKAVHDKDVDAVAQALHAAFEIADSMPHEEGPHIEGDEE